MKHHSPIAQQSGFTLVELVMAIMLIGILSYGAASLFSSRDAYSGFIAQKQLISSALLAQQVALGTSAVNNPVSLSVSVQGSRWVFSLNKTGAGNPEPIVVDASGGSVAVDGVNLVDGASQTFTWDGDANLSPAVNHEVRFSGTTIARVCLSASGYAYPSSGACPL